MNAAVFLVSLLAIGQAAGETSLTRDSFRFIDMPTYGFVSQRAISSNTPLVVYVGTPAHNIPGVLSFSVDSFEGVTGSGTVVSVPYNGDLYRADLPANASPVQVLSELSRLRSRVTQWFESQRPQQQAQPIFLPFCSPRG